LPTLAPDAVASRSSAVSQALVVEDDALERLRLARLVARAGFEVREANDAVQAIALLADRPADVVITDWELPSVSGVELCRTLAAATDRPHLIVVTARDGISDVQEALESGADDYLSKPYRAGELSARLQAARRLVTLRRRLIDRGEMYEMALRQRERALALLDDELAVASRVQAELLDQSTRPLPGTDCATIFRPAGRVGGDLFGLLPARPGHVTFFQADATGHGVPAALQAIATVAMLQTLAAREGHLLDPATAMGELNRRVAVMSPGSAACTLGLGVLDTLSGSGRLCLAGHPRPLLCRQGEEARPLGRGGLPLGALEESVYENEEFRVGPGDRLVMFSDGFVESRNPTGEAFGVDGLKAALRSCEGGSPADLAHAASRALDTFRAGCLPEDDISMLIIATTGADRNVS